VTVTGFREFRFLGRPETNCNCSCSTIKVVRCGSRCHNLPLLRFIVVHCSN